MRHAISFGLVFFASLSTGALFLACGAGDKEDPPGARGGAGGGGYDLDTIFNRDAGPDGSLAIPSDGGEKDGSADASPATPDASKVLTCESCGSAQSVTECGAGLAACRANAGCKRIYDCIYTYRGCGLTSSDIGCIQGCLDDYCDDEQSVALYLAYDQCTYCTDACEEACGSYCSGFPNSGVIPTRCTEGVSDGGTDAEPEDDGGVPDGGSDGGEVPDAGGPQDAEPEPVCVPGQQVACACVGGGEGAQICNSEGTGYGACFCAPPDPGRGGQGGEGGSGGSGGGEDDEEEEEEEEEEEDDD